MLIVTCHCQSFESISSLEDMKEYSTLICMFLVTAIFLYNFIVFFNLGDL